MPLLVFMFLLLLWADNSLMSNKLSICAVRVDSIGPEGNGITHRLRIARFCFLNSPMRPFHFGINAGFSFFDRTSYFVGWIGCNVPLWNFFSDILELGTYSERYCFVIPIIILVSTFLCFAMFGMIFSEFWGS